MFFAFFEIAIIILFGIFVRYDPSTAAGGLPIAAGAEAITNNYSMYMDVHVMIFVGFGYLMTFLKNNGFNALGMTFLLAALAIQWFLLVDGFWHCVFKQKWAYIPLNINMLIHGDFCAGAFLITYGVVLGKISPLQLGVVVFFETIFYTLNLHIGFEMKIADLGGSMVIHMFGAWFGLTLSMVCKKEAAFGNSNVGAVYTSDLFAVVGTLFLWLFWPSFNAALGSGVTQNRAVINTVCSITGSCIAAFCMSHLLRRRKFSQVDMQNATLAGGVAIGACADLLVFPGSAMAIGAIAGSVSVWGYVELQPWLEEKIGLHDTCGVNNLHGMPSMIGAIAAVIATGCATPAGYGETQLAYIMPKMAEGRTANMQAWYQFCYIWITIGIAIGSAVLTGIIIQSHVFDPTPEQALFQDEEYWEVPEKDGAAHAAVAAVAPEKGSHVALSIQDSAIGRLEATLDRVFKGLEKTVSAKSA
jgi:ammonium transporter Rh